MKNFAYIIVALALLFASFCLGRCSQPKSKSPPAEDVEFYTDTIIDTIPYLQPIPVDSVVLRYETVKLPVDTAILRNDTVTIKQDSVYVKVPIEQKEYQDSTYHAWVSGFSVNLDSIYVYPMTVLTKESVKIRAPTKRWGLGLHVGAGYYGSDKKFGPYIGVGISYNILTW